METLSRVGERRRTQPGEVLYAQGEPTSDFFVVLEGLVAVVEGFGDEQKVVRVHGPRRFLGELGLLAGQPAYVGAVVAEPGEVLVVPIESLRQLVLGDPVLGDLILRAYLMRRSLLIKLGSGFRIVGSCYSPDTKRLLEFAARNRLPHRFVDLDKDSEAEELLRQLGVAPEDTPVVVLREAEVLRNPDNAELARRLGLRRPEPERGCLRPAGGRGRPGRSRRCCVRRLGRVDSLRSRGPGHRRPGRDDVTHRELSRLPIRDLRQ